MTYTAASTEESGASHISALAMLQGVLVCCFNENHSDHSGGQRWEVAIPRFDPDHELFIILPLDKSPINLVEGITDLRVRTDEEVIGTSSKVVFPDAKYYAVITISKGVRAIQVRPKGNPVHPNPKKQHQKWQRRNKNSGHPDDYQWIADLPDAEGIKKGLKDKMTMLFIYGATFRSLRSDGEIIRADQDKTGPVIDGAIQHLPDHVVGQHLDGLDPWGFEASAGLADIYTDTASNPSGEVEVWLDRYLLATLKPKGRPAFILIRNAEPFGHHPRRGDIVETDKYRYALGDNFIYYKMFHMASDVFLHDWERSDVGAVYQLCAPPGCGDCDLARTDQFSDFSEFTK